METRSIDFSIIHLSETLSTNSYLQELDGTAPQPEGTIVYTDTQLSGRGQRGNTWESEPGKNLTFSLLLRPTHIPAGQQFLLSQVISLAMLDVLNQYATGFSIKWPNDIYWKDKKIAGILIENVLSGMTFARAIVGIGLNINQTRFVSDAPNPVSLFQITGRKYSIEEVLGAFTQAFERRYHSTFEPLYKPIQEAYFRSLYRNQGYHPYCSQGELFQAQIVGIEPDGHLHLLTESGESRRYAFKEVSFLL